MISLRENEDAYNRYKIRPRVLVNVDKVSFPLGLSPTAMHRLAHPDGELATSRAAAKHGICMGLSSYATESLENVAAQGMGNPYVMQMCVLKDREITKQLLRRAEAAGYKALFLSVDVPVLGLRLNEFRNKFVLPADMAYPNILSAGKDDLGGRHDYGTGEKRAAGEVNTADDVVLAIRHGVDGVVVSNHGGRQLDGVPATLDALRECAPAAKGKIPIAVDGGIRRGSDIFKALALGADYCFAGRMALWGLSYKGQEGVELGIKILLNEFRITMALAG
ncbi:hypothetical protein SLS54_008719 [Diplodia seriata]